MREADKIEVALRRCNSPYGVDDFLGLLRAGKAAVAIGDRMSGGVWYPEPGIAEVAYVYGKWNAADAFWLYRRMRYDMARRGVREWRWTGRKGWSRFLKRKGFVKWE